MDDLMPHVPSPADEDPSIHRFLAILPTFGPLPGFEDRVLTHVRLPAPMWLQRTRARAQTVAARRALWIVAGGLATGSAATSVAVAVLVATRPSLFAAAGRWIVNEWAAPGWRIMLEFLSGIWWTLNNLIGTLAPSGWGLVPAAAVTVAILTICSWGLYRTMQPGLTARASSNAHR